MSQSTSISPPSSPTPSHQPINALNTQKASLSTPSTSSLSGDQQINQSASLPKRKLGRPLTSKNAQKRIEALQHEHKCEIEAHNERHRRDASQLTAPVGQITSLRGQVDTLQAEKAALELRLEAEKLELKQDLNEFDQKIAAQRAEIADLKKARKSTLRKLKRVSEKNDNLSSNATSSDLKKSSATKRSAPSTTDGHVSKKPKHDKP